MSGDPSTFSKQTEVSATDRILDHALSVEWAALPAQVQQAATTFLHDTLCVGVAGRAAPDADAVWRAVQGWCGGSGPCQVLGRPGEGASAPYAAFINAYQIHAQEFDCVHEPAVAHPMATVASAVLADADRTGPRAGTELLASLVAGVDVVATLGVAVTTPLRFFRPATAGLFGSVAALCRLRGLPLEVARAAFGHALAYAAGTMQAHLEGKPTLALQVAGAARSALVALDLALAGIDAPHHVIDGPFGYLPLFESGFELDAALAELGQRWRMAELSWKPFPTGRAAHGAIVALRQLMDLGLTESQVEQVIYHAPPLIARLVGRAAVADMRPAHARLCFPYLGAVVLQRREVGLEDFTVDRLSDEKTLALAQRLSVRADGHPDPAAFVPALLEVRLVDGRSLHQRVERQFGAPEWPLSRQQHLDKAQACLAFGGQAHLHDALSAWITSLPVQRDAAGSLRGILSR
ncbi:MmgE/PrpD family protein [Roseateles sp. SL47]|uniref:MmgE/PrpD family protein n=1 Tax=Roseateles sp. SL47 TaxID=2995138 RepID=UPI00226D94AA|nr:MmgE/PrpD family protein [Roseateles sp. SL47]WAC71980.1 MmgE/PrpD family protein [Roseateles sp. SL47]